MKISKKMLILIGIIFAEGIFILSIFSHYSIYSYNTPTNELKSNINFFEPSRSLKYQMLYEGKTIVIVYNYSSISIEELEGLVDIFQKNVYFFLVNYTVPQAFIISGIRGRIFYENTIFNLTYFNLLRELCKASIDTPKECIEIE
ncbi:MAG: hypothetical protein QXP52_00530 [Candidatus Aenigmatarchaeota archaeon]